MAVMGLAYECTALQRLLNRVPINNTLFCIHLHTYIHTYNIHIHVYTYIGGRAVFSQLAIEYVGTFTLIFRAVELTAPDCCPQAQILKKNYFLQCLCIVNVHSAPGYLGTGQLRYLQGSFWKEKSNRPPGKWGIGMRIIQYREILHFQLLFHSTKINPVPISTS